MRAVFHDAILMAALLAAVPLCAPAAQPAAAELVESGFDHFYNLDYDEAILDFQQAVRLQPGDPGLRNHLAQAALFRAMFRAGALESELVTGNDAFLRRRNVEPSPEEENLFDANIGESLRLAEAALAKNPNDTRALFEQGVAYGLRANYGFLVRKSWYSALRDASRARASQAKVAQLDPSNVDARLIEGLYDYIVGSWSWQMKMLGFIAGFRGNRDRGIATVKYVAERGHRNKLDAGILLCALYRREKRAADAIPLVVSLIRQFPRNYLFRFELAQMYADLGNGDEAIAVLDEVDRLRRESASGYARLRREKIAYAKGNVRFWYDRLDDAIKDLRMASAGSEHLDLNTSVMAWLRLGQAYDLKGERNAAIKAYQGAIERAPDSDLAKEAKRYIRNRYRRAAA
jgi:tetratricopeptide (TPR) repeat protein